MMVVIMTIALLVGIVMVLIGALLLGAPESLYSFNEWVINGLYRIGEYLNKALLKIGIYVNRLVVSQHGDRNYRFAAAAFFLAVGAGLMFFYYYYSQHGRLPLFIDAVFSGWFSRVEQCFN